MDVIFEMQGTSFSVEIGYFDTVLEIKEKVQKYRGIPVSRQTLILDGKVLEDEADVWKADIYINSRITLLVAPDPANPTITTEVMSPASEKALLLLKLPGSKELQCVVMELSDTVQKLKEKIHESEGLDVNRLALYVNGKTELLDERNLHDYQLTHGSEIEGFIRPAPRAPVMKTAAAETASNKLRVYVLSKCGTKRVTVDVKPSEKVEALREELNKAEQQYGFDLPADGYFFIHMQNVMEEDESFEWQDVRHGDSIEVFPGKVTRVEEKASTSNPRNRRGKRSR
ncbi:hypothetical protein Ancab_025181 [Ancistrocladus abbreviatus]